MNLGLLGQLQLCQRLGCHHSPKYLLANMPFIHSYSGFSSDFQKVNNGSVHAPLKKVVSSNLAGCWTFFFALFLSLLNISCKEMQNY